MNKEQSLNIVLVGFKEANAIEFEKKFLQVLEIDKLKDFKFEKNLFELRSDPPIPEGILRSFIPPIIIFTDKSKNITVEYRDNEKLLIVNYNIVSDISCIETLALNIVREQLNSRITALGFNFTEKYLPCNLNDIKILNDNKNLLQSNLLKSKNIDSIFSSFSFYENDYRKTFKIEKNMIEDDDSCVISANYHFDKFKDTKSVDNIRDTIKHQLSNNFSDLYSEFIKLSGGIIEL